MSIGDALGGLEVEAAARTALAARVDELMGEFAEMLRAANIAPWPIHDREPSKYPRELPQPARRAWVADHGGPRDGVLAQPLAVDENGSWFPVTRKIVHWKKGSAAFAYWKAPVFPEDAWQPSGVPVSPTYADDIAAGHSYPAVPVREFGMFKRERDRKTWVAPLHEVLAAVYRHRCATRDDPPPTEFRR